MPLTLASSSLSYYPHFSWRRWTRLFPTGWGTCWGISKVFQCVTSCCSIRMHVSQGQIFAGHGRLC